MTISYINHWESYNHDDCIATPEEEIITNLDDAIEDYNENYSSDSRYLWTEVKNNKMCYFISISEILAERERAAQEEARLEREHESFERAGLYPIQNVFAI